MHRFICHDCHQFNRSIMVQKSKDSRFGLPEDAFPPIGVQVQNRVAIRKFPELSLLKWTLKVDVDDTFREKRLKNYSTLNQFEKSHSIESKCNNQAQTWELYNESQCVSTNYHRWPAGWITGNRCLVWLAFVVKKFFVVEWHRLGFWGFCLRCYILWPEDKMA